MDNVKTEIADAVINGVAVQFKLAHLADHCEVHVLSPTELMIRVTSTKRDGKMPRYFRVKVSESG